jgi:hypothetical protein
MLMFVAEALIWLSFVVLAVIAIDEELVRLIFEEFVVFALAEEFV